MLITSSAESRTSIHKNKITGAVFEQQISNIPLAGLASGRTISSETVFGVFKETEFGAGNFSSSLQRDVSMRSSVTSSQSSDVSGLASTLQVLMSLLLKGHEKSISGLSAMRQTVECFTLLKLKAILRNTYDLSIRR